MPEFEGHDVKVCWHKKKSVIEEEAKEEHVNIQ